MSCPHCEAPYDPTRGRLCDACGMLVGGAPPERPDPEAPARAPRCGECGVEAWGERCPNCAAVLPEPEPAARPEAAPPPDCGAVELDEDVIAARHLAEGEAAPLLEEDPDSLRELSLPVGPPVDVDAPRPTGAAALPLWPEDADARDPEQMPIVVLERELHAGPPPAPEDANLRDPESMPVVPLTMVTGEHERA